MRIAAPTRSVRKKFARLAMLETIAHQKDIELEWRADRMLNGYTWACLFHKGKVYGVKGYVNPAKLQRNKAKQKRQTQTAG